MTTPTTPTMADIVRRALRRLRVVNSRETLTTIDAAEGLEALNDMMHAWKANGVDTDHETLVGTKNFPLDEEYVQGVSALLAVRLASDHGFSTTEEIGRDAQMGWEGLEAEYFQEAPPAASDTALLRTGRRFV